MSQTPENKDQLLESGDREFFLVVAPGFERLAERELARYLPEGSPISSEHGGLSVRRPLGEGLALNRHLKIPTRILLRLASFGCRDFPKLFKKTANFPWSQIVGPRPVEFIASSHKSRLFIKKRIEETCRDGFRKSLAGREPKGEPVQVLVRLLDDVCTFSLDTSGELLHKRGTKTLTAEAPLRETIAAALLEFMSEGFSGDVTLVDPMVGSGTFAIEAAQIDQPIRARTYAFEGLLEESPMTPSSRAVRFSRFVGFDIDPSAAEAARGNWRALDDARPFDVRVADIFDAKPLNLEGPRWLIANPPYGERLKIDMRLKDYYELLFEACERVVQPDRACFLLPNTAKPDKLRAPRKWQRSRSLKFENGGLPVTALLFERAPSN